MRNIRYSGAGLASPSLISGYDPERGVRDVTIDNLVIAGKQATDLRTAQLGVGRYVEGVTVK